MCGTKYRKYLRRLIRSFKQRACKDCGVEYHYKEMSFDHIRGQKLFNLGGSVKGLTERDVRAEIAKCEVVCISCHIAREAARMESKEAA